MKTETWKLGRLERSALHDDASRRPGRSADLSSLLAAFRFLLLAFCSLTSCTQLKYSATTKAGSETFAYNSFGGSGALDSAGGTRLTHNHNKSAGQFFQAVTAIAGGVAAAYTKNSDNALSATQAAQTTAREANVRTPTIVPPASTAPDTTVFPLVIPPPKPIVP